MSGTPPETSPLVTVGKMAAEAIQRIALADAKAMQAQYAFAAGKFQEFYQQEYEAAERAIQDEFNRLSGGSSATGGDGEKGG